MVRCCAACSIAWVGMMRNEEDFAAIDWQGRPIDCNACPQRALFDAGRCRPAHACINDRYARRIDRFFRWNPTVGNDGLTHPYFEVRAISAKHADLFRLPALLADEDETVRWSAAQRLPGRYLEQLAADPHREVRIRVAQRLDPSRLGRMMHDPDYYVRAMVARRLPVALLPLLRADPDDQVRIEVARRLPAEHLLAMKDDRDPGVRAVVAQRLPPGLLVAMAQDPDCLVRHEVARRIAVADLDALLDDEDEIVREAARARLDENTKLPGKSLQ